MKLNGTMKATRHYRQKARAVAAEASSRRILDAFLKRAETEWFEKITLDSVAADAGVTVQTVVRKYRNKSGLVQAAHAHFGEGVTARRAVAAGDIDRAIDVLTNDYEASGNMVLRLLSQEDMHPVLKPAIENGRRGHREWLGLVFTDILSPLPPARRTAMLDALVVATDVYVWKLIRIDMGRPVSAFKSVVKRMVLAALDSKQAFSQSIDP